MSSANVVSDSSTVELLGALGHRSTHQLDRLDLQGLLPERELGPRELGDQRAGVSDDLLVTRP
ncbi:hypothetical protein ACFVWZ_07875 [Streptomyces sp. NPDC058200]|uniref:hypothetical protein n=1 Tax=Streptomyces sp. NPDC058200 TaxID=3346378 RepID=UPI0036E5064E